MQELAPEENKAIPLPPPVCPTKAEPNTQTEASLLSTQQNESAAEPEEAASQIAQDQSEATVQDPSTNPPVEIPVEKSSAESTDGVGATVDMELRQSSPMKEVQPQPESEQQEVPPIVEQHSEPLEAEKQKKEPPPVPAKPCKSPKKAKKAKKQPPEPVSEAAIPLPAPGQSI